MRWLVSLSRAETGEWRGGAQPFRSAAQPERLLSATIVFIHRANESK